MNRDSTALVAPARSGPPAVAPLGPVLIRVPALRRDPRGGGSRSAGRVLTRRRRLRREVRLTATAFLVVGPLGLALSIFPGAGSPNEPVVAARLIGIEGVAGSFAPHEETHALSLPALPSALRVSVPASGQFDNPVVLPGYVLPDDGNEEPAHAGG